MDNSRSVVIYFDHGGTYSDVGDEVRWNRKDRHVSTLVLKRSYEEVTYSHLVDRIGRKMKIDVGASKIQMSYFPLTMDHKRPCYIMDDEDVLGYLLEVDKNQRRSVLHVELTQSVSANQSNEMLSRNEEIQNEARDNGDMVGLKELSTMPHIEHDGNERTNEVSDEMHALEELAVVTPTETPILNVEWDDGIDMTLHQEFETKHEVRDLVDKAVHKNCFEVDIVKSKPRLYVLKCRGVGCKWYLRAAKLHNSDFFSIRTYRKMHTCVRIDASATRKGKRGTPSMVASVLHADYPGKYKTPAPKDLIDLVHNRRGVRVSYSTALRGKNKAINDVRGNPQESFARLPSYLYMLEKLNPNTVTRLVVDEKNQFKYMFFAVGACIEGFQSMRKVIIMDGTHLKGVYKGVLLIATAQDPDHHHYPLAFAVVDGEKNASWKWFLTILKTLIPDDPQLVFCTDRNQSIIKTVHEVYPLAIHGYCIYHLSNNVKGACSNVRKDVVAHKFKKIAGIYTEREFRRKYNDFRRKFPQAADYLDESVHETKWARSQFPGERYNIDTTNTVESMNGVFKDQRKYALLPLIDEILGKIIEWFNKYRQLSISVPQRQLLVPRVHTELHENCPIAKTLHVEVLNSFELVYNITGQDGKGYLVDLVNRRCSCRHFEIDRYPCVHALAAILRHAGTTKDVPLEDLVENYCSKYYWMEQWKLAYCRTIYPVPHHSSWQVPEEIQSQVVLPPYVEKKKGRLQVTRFPSAGESRRKRKKSYPPFSEWIGHSSDKDDSDDSDYEETSYEESSNGGGNEESGNDESNNEGSGNEQSDNEGNVE